MLHIIALYINVRKLLAITHCIHFFMAPTHGVLLLRLFLLHCNCYIAASAFW